MAQPELSLKRRDFPEDFLFGAATSAYQIEGHGQGGAGSTHWDTFAATPGNVAGAEHGGVACDHIGHLDEDLDLIAGANLDVYRFSSSWARVQPDGRGKPNDEGLDFYDRLVDGLAERGVKAALTLYHWELPSPLADSGGWTNRDIAERFADYARIVQGRIGDRLWSVAPINEPFCVAWLGHFTGDHAPGLRDVRATARAMHHVMLAHGRAIAALRDAGQDNLGGVFNFEYLAPADNTAEAQDAARRYDAIYNRWYIGGALNGAYPDEITDGLEPHMPDGWQDDMRDIAAPLDWVGLNYYTRKLIAADPGPWPHLTEVDGPLPKTQVGWEVFPEGLHAFLKRVHEGYTRGLPLYVTENGMAWNDAVQDGTCEDPQRIDYLNRHMAQVKRAIDEDVPVKGYFAWSLMDNYEWALGYGPRFGLVHVGYPGLRRTPKASYHALSAALER